MRTNRAVAAVFVVAALFLSTVACAQGFPAKPVRIVVGFPPGGGTDILARVIAERLTQSLGQSAYVENRPGANGILAAEVVAKSAPDGHTLLVTNSPHVLNQAMYARVPFDPIADFEPVGLIAALPYLLVANPKTAGNTLRELVAFAKANPKRLTYGLPGIGTMNHLSMELLKQMAGIDVVGVPYKGGAPAQTDVIAGHVDMMMATTAQAASFVRGGKLKAYVVARHTRVPDLPDVPTAAEAGYPDFQTDVWIALLAPARTPAPIVARLNGEIARALQAPETRERLAAIGAQPLAGPPEQLAELMRRDQVRWTRVIRDIGIKPE
jgi:tripartite-type tricarboxylate transporter receptor subunit TctC